MACESAPSPQITLLNQTHVQPDNLTSQIDLLTSSLTYRPTTAPLPYVVNDHQFQASSFPFDLPDRIREESF